MITIPPLVTIRTTRLLLREFNLGDAAALFSYGRLPEVVHYGGAQPYATLEEVELVLERFVRWQFDAPRQNLVLAITLDGRLVGDIGLNTRDEAGREAELGFTLHPDFWRQGIGSEAAAAMLDYGFGVAGWESIYALCNVENVASAGLLRKIGLGHESLLSRHRRKAGNWHDFLRFSLSRQEWAGRAGGSPQGRERPAI